MRFKIRVFDTRNEFEYFNCYILNPPVELEDRLNFEALTEGIELDRGNDLVQRAIQHGLRVVKVSWEDGEQVILTEIDYPYFKDEK